jgi:hypothetical protein
MWSWLFHFSSLKDSTLIQPFPKGLLLVYGGRVDEWAKSFVFSKLGLLFFGQRGGLRGLGIAFGAASSCKDRFPFMTARANPWALCGTEPSIKIDFLEPPARAPVLDSSV